MAAADSSWTPGAGPTSPGPCVPALEQGLCKKCDKFLKSITPDDSDPQEYKRFDWAHDWPATQACAELGCGLCGLFSSNVVTGPRNIVSEQLSQAAIVCHLWREPHGVDFDLEITRDQAPIDITSLGHHILSIVSFVLSRVDGRFSLSLLFIGCLPLTMLIRKARSSSYANFEHEDGLE